MAEENKDPTKQEDAKKEPTNVASLSIPTIIAALHQNAMKNANPTSKGMVLTNTALEGDGKDAKLGSAGEHIISVRPDKDGGTVQKVDAIKVLQTYVQWFVGPDLAKKVDDKTVVSLTEAPGTEGKQKNESAKFMSFGQFLLEETAPEEDDADDATEEEDEDIASEEDDVDAAEEDDGEGAEEVGDEDSTSEEGGGEGGTAGGEKTTDESKESKAGYYIAYNLKVEGLPQTALKDAMKKYAKNFFDDVTFTASGLFGGGKSFTVKDVKDAWKSAFGPIDPHDLVNKVKSNIEKKMPGKSEVGLDVEIRDKKTLLSDLGSNVKGQQRKDIDSADYSLWISIGRDGEKAAFNTRTIADIVTSSIKGLYKKFKNAITKDKVIYIPDYIDVNADKRAVRKLFNMVPDYKQMAEIIAGSKPYSTIDTRMDKLRNDKQFDNCPRAMQVVDLWDKNRKKFDKNAIDKSEPDQNKKTFSDFLTAYKTILDNNKDDSLDESKLDALNRLAMLKHRLYDNNYMSKSLMSQLFEGDDEEIDTASEGDESTSSISSQESSSDEDSNKEKYELSKDKIDSIAKQFSSILKSKFGIQSMLINPSEGFDTDAPKNTVKVGTYDDIKDKFLGGFTSGKNEFEEACSQNDYNNGKICFIVVATAKPKPKEDDKDKKDNETISKSLSESIKSSLFKLLFESYPLFEENSSDNSTNSSLPVNWNDFEKFVKTIDFKKIIGINGSNILPFSIEIPEAFGNKFTIFFIPFNIDENEELKAPVKVDAADAKSSTPPKGKIDLYIIPMPGLKYKDDEEE